MKTLRDVARVCLFVFTLALVHAADDKPLATTPSTPLAETPTTAFIAQVSDHFKNWDLDGNGQLSVNELDAIAVNPKITGKEAAAIASLKRASNSTKVPVPVMTLDNIVKLSKTPPPALEGPNFPRMYSEGLTKITKANRTVFVAGVPQLAGIHQGRLGDCFCLAPLGAMLHRDPQQVVGMFHVLPDNMCEVKLGKQTVTISMPTDAELAMSSSNKQDGVWVNLYEKALGVARNDAKPEKERVGVPIDALAHGGSAGTVLAQITGHDIVRFSCKPFTDEKTPAETKAMKLQDLRTQLSAALREKRLVTCGTPDIKATPGMTPHHAYAVMDYDPKADAIQLWNPHGSNFTPKEKPSLAAGYPRKDGIFSMPLADFVQLFSGLAFEQLPKATQ